MTRRMVVELNEDAKSFDFEEIGRRLVEAADLVDAGDLLQPELMPDIVKAEGTPEPLRDVDGDVFCLIEPAPRSMLEIEGAISALETRELLDREDTFKHGYLIGKLQALEWAKGEIPGGELAINYDFETWDINFRDAMLRLRENGKGWHHDD